MSELTIKDFRKTPNLAELEEKILQFWENEQVFAQSLKQRENAENFSFYDGPPFATGLPHYGHLMQSMIKDLIPRYQTMKGKHVRRVWGWDCHGLPIENLIEKDLNLKDKQAIEDFGVAAFNQACQARVLTYAQDWEKTIKRIGRFIDMKNAYKTMDKAYMESVWWVFNELYKKGLIYQSHKAMHICPRCSTPLSNFEVTQGYQDVKDLAVTTKFKLLDTNEEIYFLSWTTTAWTLPGNMFLAVNPDLDYVLVELKGHAEKYYLAKSRLAEVFADRDFQVVKTIKGRELIGLNYQPVFPYFSKLKEDQDLTVEARKLLFTVQAGERIGLIGANGAGKSTLFRMILGGEKYDGDLWKTAGMTMGYLSQTVLDLPEELTMAEYFYVDTFQEQGLIRTNLMNLGFTKEHWHLPMSALSMGERVKVKLMQFILEGVDVLVLDEPTNHLDLPSREELEKTLESFPGTLLFASHDR